MESRTRRWAIWLVAVVLAGPGAIAQTTGQTTTFSAATQQALHEMSALASVIFVGRVTAVRHVPGSGGASGVVEIDFAVDEAIRGVSGGSYTLREWAGLWAGGVERFRVGQRLLMLLHAPGAAGLSSPVGGMDGAIPIAGAPAVEASVAAARVSAPVSAPGASATENLSVDLRWIATRVARAATYRADSMARGTSRLGQAIGADAPAALAVIPAIEEPAGDPQVPSYGSVLTALRSWEKENHAAR